MRPGKDLGLHMIGWLLLTLATVTCDQFSVQLSVYTRGMQDFPAVYEQSLGYLAEQNGLSKNDITALTFGKLVSDVTQSTWESNMKGYLNSLQVPSATIGTLSVSTISLLVKRMPFYDLQDFWEKPLKVFVYQVSRFVTAEGSNEVLVMLRHVHKDASINVIDVIKPYLFDGYNSLENGIEKLHLKSTMKLLDGLSITRAQMSFVTSMTIEELNALMAEEVFKKLHKHDTRAVHEQVKRAFVQVQLLKSSFYYWSVTCKNPSQDPQTVTLEQLSKLCFKQGFVRTAFALYSLPNDRSNIYKNLNVEEAHQLANRSLQLSSLVPASWLVQEMYRGLKQVEDYRRQPYILLARNNGISMDLLQSGSVGDTLTKMHHYSWQMITRVYDIVDFIAVKARTIPFVDLSKIVNGENPGVEVDLKFLQLLPLNSVLLALSANVKAALLFAQFKESVLMFSNRPVTVLQRVYQLTDDTLKDSTLTSLTFLTFGIEKNDFVSFYELDTDEEYEFFKRTTIEDIGTLLKLQENDLKNFTIANIIAELKKSLKYYEIMLLSPENLAEQGGESANVTTKFSVPQIVHSYKSDVIKSSNEFFVYIETWSNSASAARMLREQSLDGLSLVLTRPVHEIVSARIVDIINAVLDSFGRECDAETIYCEALQPCRKTRNGYRCQCEVGYRFSGPNTCTDLNECKYASVTCHEHAQCINTRGSYTCKCNHGFKGDGHTCENINECFEVGVCSNFTNTWCKDTPGSFVCACKHGFVEVNGTCVDRDECKEKAYRCHEYGECVNTVATYRCQCQQGFSGDGVTTCNDVNECEQGSHVCLDNSYCKNTFGDHDCICKAGFFKEVKSSKYCHQCSADKLTCHKYATCFQDGFSKRCVCKSGFVGNGSHCEDYNECIHGIPCGKMGQCRNHIGSHSCLCDGGFAATLDNKGCIDIDECTESKEQGVVLCEKENQQCENLDGSYACAETASSTAISIGFGVTIPLIIILAFLIAFFYFRHRRMLGKKELTNFDQKLRAITNTGFQPDNDDVIAVTSSVTSSQQIPRSLSTKEKSATGGSSGSESTPASSLQRSGSLNNFFKQHRSMRYFFNKDRKGDENA